MSSNKTLDAVLAEARGLISEDADRAPRRWRRLLKELARLVFDRDPMVDELRRFHKLRLSSDSEEFRRIFSVGLSEYRMGHQLETGRRLVLETELRVWDIGRAVGYSLHRSSKMTHLCS